MSRLRTHANRQFLSNSHPTLCSDGSRRFGRSPRRHSFRLPRLDGSVRARALGLWKDRAFHRIRPRLRQSVCRYRTVGALASGIFLSSRRPFQNLRHRNAGLGARGSIVKQFFLGVHWGAGFSSGPPSVRPARCQVGRLGMGFFSVRYLLWRRLGVVDLPGCARTLLPVFVRVAFGKLVAQARLACLRCALRIFRAH
jgi:hypothetical protein